MTYLHCPRCRLAIRRQVDYLSLVNCPRCLARTAIAVPLFTSPLNGGELRRAAAPSVPNQQTTVTGVRP
jgi:tRNA G26 N,N-dimethylase Trm1